MPRDLTMLPMKHLELSERTTEQAGERGRVGAWVSRVHNQTRNDGAASPSLVMVVTLIAIFVVAVEAESQSSG